MIDKLKNSPIFAGMTDGDIEAAIKCSRANIISYEKNEIIFHQNDSPEFLMVLVEGYVVVCNDSITGRRSIVASIDHSGQLFGEVFVFLKCDVYDHYAQAMAPTKVLLIPKSFLFQTCGDNCGFHSRMISNMLMILAKKAYFLNQKVQILSCASIRQKIAKVLLKNCNEDGKVSLNMNREELADFLNTARPSLSRELMNMQEEGLIRIQKRDIFITDFDELQNIL